MLKSHAHKEWAGEKKPSMKRRCEARDYYERGIYMVTLVIEGRRPILGRLAGKSDVKEGPDAPHVELSAFGEKVKQCWMDIPRYHPEVEVMRLCIMPDHLHGVLFVHERMEKHLGHVINGFKTGTRRAARELGIEGMLAVAMPQPTQPQEPSTFATPASVGYAAALPQQAGGQKQQAGSTSKGVIWEKNYNDSVLWAKGRLQRMLAYVDDNPRRLLLKREHPEYFTQLSGLIAAGLEMTAMGNRFLLQKPIKIQVQCSRSMTAEETDHYKAAIIQRARAERAAIVSPCISPGEQQTATAALEAGLPLIVLLLKGIRPLFKPQPRYLQACEEGRLLMLSPYPFQNEKIENMRQRCLHLNSIAAKICSYEEG